jgi:lipopolysaccharide/colanic/teichoic acid biosynthesis glycosyltransferase
MNRQETLSIDEGATVTSLMSGAQVGTPRGKRVFDVSFAGLGLIFSFPLWILVAVGIKLEDGGPVFYRQERVGQGGRSFWSWKFRSMIPDADARFGPKQAEHADERVTRVGRLLRATALDELPQLWNIFKGDMSFVGPRPLMPTEIETNGNGKAIPIEEIPGYIERHQVQPGLTGLAQVYAPRDIPRQQKFRFDLAYIENQNLLLDFKLIAISFWITVRGKWESGDKKF